jgi:hypothetical protein
LHLRNKALLHSGVAREELRDLSHLRVRRNQHDASQQLAVIVNTEVYPGR